MTVFIGFLSIAVIVLFIFNSRNQSGIVGLKKELIALKKQVWQMQDELFELQKMKAGPYKSNEAAKTTAETTAEPTSETSSETYSETATDTIAEPTFKVTSAATESVKIDAVQAVQEGRTIGVEAERPSQNIGYQRDEKASPSALENMMAKISVNTKSLFSVESIITKLGILLFLIGLGYLYKLAYDNGFITKGLSMVFGEILGVAILGLGYYVSSKNRSILSQVLFGGGIATLYIVTFVGYSSYDLYPGFFAFTFFCIITVIAFYIALSIDSKTMGIIGILGSLLTPFMVDIEYIGFFGMGVYLFVLSVGAMGIYLFKRWRVLQLATIIGVYFVTFILHGFGNFTDTEGIQFSVLLLLLFIVFIGLEYVLYYLSFETIKAPVITLLLFMAIPLISVLHIVDLLQFTSQQWGIFFLCIALMYIAAYVPLYRKRGHMPINDIIIGYVGVFVFSAVVLALDGDIRLIMVLLLSLMFFAVNRKMPYLIMRIIAYAIYGIGFMWCFVDFGDKLFGSFRWIDTFVQLSLLVILFVGVLFQKKWIRKVFGSLVLITYGLPVLLRAGFELGEKIEPIVVFLIIIGLYSWLLILLFEKLQCISIFSVITMSSLPLLLQIATVTEYTYGEMPLYVFITGIAYCINLFILGLYTSDKLSPLVNYLIRVLSYSMLIINLLMYMYIITDRFIFGLVLSGAFIIGLLYFEKDSDDAFMPIYLLLLKIGFIAISFMYGVTDRHSLILNYPVLLGDIALLVLIVWILKELELVNFAKLLIHMLLFMIVAYQTFHWYDKGVVSLLWAAYGIIGLFVTVYRRQREETYVTLGMIIFVAVRFILIDLSSVETVFKVVTSMVFGIALLILSYFIQPIIAHKDND